MTVVADSSALVASLVDYGSDGRWVEDSFAGEDLTCSELALAEASNILRRMELSGQLSHTEAAAAYAELLHTRHCSVSVHPVRRSDMGVAE